MTDKTPLSLMQWIVDNLPELPACKECGARAYTQEPPGGGLKLRCDHRLPCSPVVEIVDIVPGELTSTRA
jgi:hypothetical protein